ncbi:MAG TPA: flagellar hook-associated protein FlgL [Bacillales bacterium]|nr:flagellar hook-associated protein FlgL [Bacillales bacterium]
MRITQNMLTNSNLSYISKNYERLGKLQDQINTGKKITRPSDDPVVAMKGMRYRSQLVEVKQFYRNLTEGFIWMDNTDAALEETTQILNRVRELTVQASNDSYDPVARGNIAKEIEQLQQHLVSIANTKIGDNYIFNGTDTAKLPINENQFNLEFSQFTSKLGAGTIKAEDYVVSYHGQTYKYSTGTTFESSDGSKITIDPSSGEVSRTYTEALKNKDGEPATFTEKINSTDIVISNKDAVSSNNQDVEIEGMKGVTVPINVRPQDAFPVDLFSGIESIKKMLTNPDTKGTEITKALDAIDQLLNGVVSTRAELGARQNRVEMVENRLLQQQIVAEKTVSDNEDVDFEKVIIDLTIQESIHRASLAVGARIIQPTLMDFLR